MRAQLAEENSPARLQAPILHTHIAFFLFLVIDISQLRQDNYHFFARPPSGRAREKRKDQSTMPIAVLNRLYGT